MKKETRALAVSVLIALCIFVAGFGVMWIFWTFYPKDTGLPGFTDYLAATYGDGLFLPILVGSAYMFTKLGVPLFNSQKRMALTVALAFGVLGALLQASWIISDTTALNWTIPEQHTFNHAGWYHAVYFTLMFALCGYSLMCVAFSRFKKRAKQEPMLRILTYALFWFAASGYILLHGQDDWTNRFTQAEALLVFFAFSAALSLIFSIVTVRRLRYCDIVALLGGASFAAGVANYFAGDLTGIQNSLIMSVSFALIAAVLVRPCLSSVGQTIMSATLIMTAAFGLLTVSILPIMLECRIAIAAVSLVVLLFVFYLFSYKLSIDTEKNNRSVFTNKDLLPMGIAMVASAYIFISSVAGGAIPELVDLCLYGLVFTGVVYHVLDMYKSVQDLEKSTEDELREVRSRKVTKAQQSIFTVTAAMGTGVFLMILTSLYSIYSMSDFELMAVAIPVISNLQVVALLLIIIAMIVLVSLSFLKSYKLRLAGIPLLAFAYILVTFYVFDFRTPFFNSWFYLLFACCIPGSCLFIADGFASNCRNIRGIPLDLSTRITSLIIFVGMIMTLCYASLPTKDDLHTYLPSITSPLVGLLGIILAALVFPCLAGLLLRKPLPEVQVTENTPVMGVFQGGVTGSIISLFSVLIPFHLIAVWANVENPGLTIVIGFVAYLGAIMFAVEKPIDNTLEHFQDRKRRAKILIEQNPGQQEEVMEQLEQISKHLKRQMAIFVLGLLPWSLAPAIHMWATKGDGKAGLSPIQFVRSYFWEPLSDLSLGHVELNAETDDRVHVDQGGNNAQLPESTTGDS